MAAVPFYVGGSFSNDPGVCALSFHDLPGFALVPPEEGACVYAAGAWNTINFAIMTHCLARFVQSVAVDTSRAACPHRPVRYR